MSNEAWAATIWIISVAIGMFVIVATGHWWAGLPISFVGGWYAGNLVDL